MRTLAMTMMLTMRQPLRASGQVFGAETPKRCRSGATSCGSPFRRFARFRAKSLDRWESQ